MKAYSVTSVIHKYSDFSHVKEDVLEAAQGRGSVVHAASAHYALGFWSIIPEEYRGYFKSYTDWFGKYVVEVLAVEREFRDEALGIVGHPDLIAIIKGDTFPSLIDLKTAAAPQKLWRLQLGAYKHLILPIYPNLARTFSLRLDINGGAAKVREYTESHAEDLAVFLSALNVHRWLDAA